MFISILWRFLILETVVLGVLSNTTCTKKHLQFRYCDNSIVIKTKLTTPIPSSGPYRMEVRKFYKGNNSILNTTIHTYVNVETEVHLTQTGNRTYDVTGDPRFVIFGNENNGNLKTSACDGIIPWNNLTAFQRIGFRTYYKNSCNCASELPEYSVAVYCEWKYGALRMHNRTCKWIGKSDLEKCKKVVG